MSASNWAICPACKANELAKQETLRKQVEEAYGKIPLADWELLRAQAEVPTVPRLDQTFREDYEIYGASTGVVTVSYSGHCKVCKSGLDFTSEHPIRMAP